MTNYKRGDIIIVLFPFGDLYQVKRRPALVVQADDVPSDLGKVIVAQISSNTSRAAQPSRVLIQLTDALAIGTNLRQDSVVLTDLLATIDLNLIDRKIGQMPSMDAVNTALKKTLALNGDDTKSHPDIP